MTALPRHCERSEVNLGVSGTRVPSVRFVPLGKRIKQVAYRRLRRVEQDDDQPIIAVLVDVSDIEACVILVAHRALVLLAERPQRPP